MFIFDELTLCSQQHIKFKTELNAVEVLIRLNIYIVIHYINLLWKRESCGLLPHLCAWYVAASSLFSGNDIKCPSTNNSLATGHFSFFFHHCSILHCISLAAETMHLDLHTLINTSFPAGKGQHQLTFPSYHSASTSNNNIASQQEPITPQ